MPTDTLGNMVRNLRSEVGHSLSVAQGVNAIETLKYYLKRTQEELWTAFTFPDLKQRADITLSAGAYQYNFPDGMTYDQIRQAWGSTSGGDNWNPVGFGIPEDLIRTDGTSVTTGDPVILWDTDASGKVRVYPTPAVSGGGLRLIGNKALGQFVDDADMSTLDATAIVLFASAELLARAKSEDAAGKEKKAQRHLTKLLGAKISAKMKVSTLGGWSPRPVHPTPGIDYIA